MIPSNLAAVTLAFRQAVLGAMPTKVEVSTLPPATAEKFVKLGGLLARVNLYCYQVSATPSLRNISLARPDPATPTEPKFTPLTLSYLVTVYGTALPDEEQSAERLLEATYRVIEQHAFLSPTMLENALPGPAGSHRTLAARVVTHDLALTELQAMFLSMQAVYRPSLAYRVTLAEG